MVEPSLKEVVKAMCKAYPGGREAMAGALGMSVTQFNNNLYEKNGCRFFDAHGRNPDRRSPGYPAGNE